MEENLKKRLMQEVAAKLAHKHPQGATEQLHTFVMDVPGASISAYLGDRSVAGHVNGQPAVDHAFAHLLIQGEAGFREVLAASNDPRSAERLAEFTRLVKLLKERFPVG